MSDLGGTPKQGARKIRPENLETATATPHGEVFQDTPTSLVGCFYLPSHGPREVKYHVGRRTITLWSRKEGNTFQTILVLPRWVNPETFILSHNNGMYEFHLEVASRPEGGTPPGAAGPGLL